MSSEPTTVTSPRSSSVTTSANADMDDRDNQSDSQIVTLNVGGQEFTTFISTLTNESKFFAKLFSANWRSSSDVVRLKDQIFIDADPVLFRHILTYCQRLTFPLFWSRNAGFDYALYRALRGEAAFFGVHELEKWIEKQKYLKCITVESWIESIEEDGCWARGKKASPSLVHSDDTETIIDREDIINPEGTWRHLYKKRISLSG